MVTVTRIETKTEAVQFYPGIEHPWVERQMLFQEGPTEEENIQSIKETGFPAYPKPMKEYECVRGNTQWLRPVEGDWIVRNEEGHLVLMKPEAFNNRYYID